MPLAERDISSTYSKENGYCHLIAFDLNTPEQTKLGEPASQPSDSFLVSYVRDTGRYNLLIDAGKRGQGKHIIIPALLERGIERIDQIVITHMHKDHFGGVIDLMEDGRIAIGQIIYNPLPEEIILAKNRGNHPEWVRLNDLLLENSAIARPVGTDQIGTRTVVDSEFYWEFVDVPDVDQTPQFGINDLNIVLKMSFRRFTALFPGDCGSPQAEKILSSDQIETVKDVFLLKAAHHGKGESLTKPLIERCNAQVVLIPSNPGIVRGFGAQLMEHQFEYNANGAKVYRMDQYQGFELYTDGTHVLCEGRTRHFTETASF